MHCVTCGSGLPPESERCPNCKAPTPYNHSPEQKEFGQPISFPSQTEGQTPLHDAQKSNSQPDLLPTTIEPQGGQPDLPKTVLAQENSADQPSPQGGSSSPQHVEITPVAPTLPGSNERIIPAPNPQQGPFIPPPPTYPYNPSSPQNPAYPPPFQQSGVPHNYQQRAPLPYQPGAYGAPPPNYYGVPPKQKSKSSAGKILLFVGIALLLLCSGLSLIGYTAVIHPLQVQAEATATAGAFKTQQDQIATATIVVQDKATGTAQAVATTGTQATVTTQQGFYTQATKGNPSVTDAMDQNSDRQWSEGTTATGESCTFSNGALHASVQTKHIQFMCDAHNTNADNFAYQVDMSIVKGDGGGVLFRADPANFKNYFFEVTKDGQYALVSYSDRNGTSAKLLADGSSDAIKKGLNQTNTLTVIAKGSTISLYINKQYLTNIQDTTYTTGEIGVVSAEKKNDTEVAFNNLKLWNLGVNQ